MRCCARAERERELDVWCCARAERERDGWVDGQGGLKECAELERELCCWFGVPWLACVRAIVRSCGWHLQVPVTLSSGADDAT